MYTEWYREGWPGRQRIMSLDPCSPRPGGLPDSMDILFLNGMTEGGTKSS